MKWKEFKINRIFRLFQVSKDVVLYPQMVVVEPGTIQNLNGERPITPQKMHRHLEKDLYQKLLLVP